MTDRATANRKRPTLRDVAREARVSLMTVSNVVNRNFGAMSQETRERVEQAIAEIGYRPQGMARSLRLDRNLAVGILIVDPLSSFLADPFISQVVAGLSNSLGLKDYGCLVHGVTPANFERSIFLGDSRTDGICAFLSGDHETRRGYLERLLSLQGPVIGIEDTNVGIDPDLAIVRQDDFNAGMQLTQRLLAMGCRQLFVLAPELPWPSVTQRLKGIAEALRIDGSNVGLSMVMCGTGTIAEAEERFRCLVVDAIPPNSAIIGASDRLAVAAARIAATYRHGEAHGCHVGSFSASEASRDLSIFDVVAVSDPYRIGVEAGRLMLDRLRLGYFEVPEVTIPVPLVATAD
jgi:LacI family transcriptional regulator